MVTLGIDLGQASLGLCISDELEISLNPLTNIRFNKTNYKQAIRLFFLLLEGKLNRIEQIVIGWPTNTTDPKIRTKMMDDIEFFVLLLKENFVAQKVDIPIIYFDESYSTQNALEALLEQGASLHDFKANKDSMAACVILKYYFESKN